MSFKTTKNYTTNLQNLLSQIDLCKPDSIIVAPEVVLSGFDYENFQDVLDFTPHANRELLKVSQEKTIILTLIQREGEQIFNMLKVYHKGLLVHERPKAKLFRLGDEHRYFGEGKKESVTVFELDGIKLGVLVCFELRFKELWKQLEGCDVIAVVAWWGIVRSAHLRALTKALAIMNQCYVVVSDSANEVCSGYSAVIDPNGDERVNRNEPCLEVPYNPKEIVKMRRYIDVGIDG